MVMSGPLGVKATQKKYMSALNVSVLPIILLQTMPMVSVFSLDWARI
jgi:hypothetical protein